LTMTAAARAADTPPPRAPPPALVAAPAAPAAPTVVAAGPSFDAPSLRGPSVWGIVPWGGYGIGARMMFPLGIPGIVHAPNVRDTFGLEVGADLLHWSYDYGIPGNGFNYSWTEILAVADVMWSFWFSNQFALYPKLGLGYAFGWFSGWDSPGPRPTYGGFFVSGDAGAIYKLAGGLSLRAEVGSDGLKAGAGWLF